MRHAATALSLPLALALSLLTLSACGGEGAPAPPPPADSTAAGAPSVGTGRLLIAWDRQGPLREQILIGVAGVALGPFGSPLTRYLHPNPERAADAHFLARTFAPFEVKVDGGRLRFAGAGQVKASPAEWRMIVEWARLAAVEAEGGGGGAAYSLALTWHRGGGAGGGCDDVSVYLTGEARASSCGWDEEIRGRLTRESLARLYDWFDRYRPLQEATMGKTQGGLPTRLIFAGVGETEAPSGERTAMEQFALALHRELAARRPATEPVPAATEPARTAPRPPTPPPPAVRLLRPPDPAPDRPAPIVVPESALPRTPPAPPVPRSTRGASAPAPPPAG